MKRYIINGLIILFILSIIPVTVYLVRQQQILKSRAALDQSVVFFGEGASEKDGQYIATQLTGIRVKLISPIIQPVNDAEPISMDCPQNSTVNPGGQISATVVMKNTGNTVWDSNYRLGLLDGTDPNNTNKGDALSQLFGTYHLPLTSSVNSQDQTTISLTLTAPQQTGNYVVQWQMLKERVGWFGGKSKQCSFTVSKVTATPTPTTTPTPTPTPVSLKPADPTGLSVNCPAPGSSANLSWNGVSGATRYTIWAFDHTPSSADYSTCTQGPNICGYTVTGTTANNLGTWAGINYRWSVFACNSSGCSPNGASAQQVCSQPTPAPTAAPTPTPTPTAPPSNQSPPKGFLDWINCDQMAGWACDGDNYGTSLDIQFFDGQAGNGGTFIGNIAANAQRETGVGNQCGGNANHGFFFTTPSAVKDGKAHQIYAYAINIPNYDSSSLLTGAPKTLTCGAVRGVAIAAEHSYTASFKVAKSQAELASATAQDYSADPTYIDFAFSSPTPGATEALFVEFTGQGGEKMVKQATITYQPPVISTPTPTPSASSNQVWFNPNRGSRDMLELFAQPEKWAVARSKINVFKFSLTQLTNWCAKSECGNNLLDNFAKVDAFRNLKKWGIDTAIEIPTIWGCEHKREIGQPKNDLNADEMSKRDIDIINVVNSSGGNVRYLALDEMRYHGMRTKDDGSPLCDYTEAEVVNREAQYIANIIAAHPEVSIGDIEPYPALSAEELERWVTLLEQQNTRLAFFHLDFDLTLAQQRDKDWVGDLKKLRTATESRGIPFGLIFTSLSGEAGKSDQVYYNETLARVREIHSKVGTPTHSIFESWVYDPVVDAQNKKDQDPGNDSSMYHVSDNLPENDPSVFSHTRLLNEGYQILNPGSASTPTPTPKASSYIDPQYLLVNKVNAMYGGSNTATCCVWTYQYPNSITGNAVDEIRDRIFGAGSSVSKSDLQNPTRRLGINFTLDYLNTPAENSTQVIANLTKISEEKDFPVLIVLEGNSWWDDRPDLWNWWDPRPKDQGGLGGYNPDNKNNVEWSSWDPNSAIKISWRNWGAQFRTKPAPNLGSLAYIDAKQQSINQLVPQIARWYKNLPPDKKYLLAGVVLDGELSIGLNNYYWHNGNDYLAKNDPYTCGKNHDKPCIDPDGDAFSDGMDRTGYAAVKSYNIKKEGQLTNDDLNEVIRRHAAMLTDTARKAGLSEGVDLADKLYIHGHQSDNPYYPYSNALTGNGRPGWSLYTYGPDPTQGPGLSSALDQIAGSSWAALEWNPEFNDEVTSGKLYSYDQWKEALSKTFNYRNNRLIAVYNWDTANGIGPKDPAVSAIKSTLSEQPSCLVTKPTLDEVKIDGQKAIFSWAKGEDSQALYLNVAADNELTLSGNLKNASLVNTPVTSQDSFSQSFSPGTYYWNVTADGCNGSQRRISETKSFTIGSAARVQNALQNAQEALKDALQNIPVISSLISTPAPTPQPTPSPTPIPAPAVTFSQTDFNGDNKTNALDVSTIFSNLGKKTSELKNSKTDLNRDGVVNSLDYSLFLKNYKP